MVVYVYKSLWIRVQYKLKKTCTVGCGKSNVGIKKLSVQHTLLLIRDNRNDFEYTYDLANDEIRHPSFTCQALFCFILKYREGFFFYVLSNVKDQKPRCVKNPGANPKVPNFRSA